MSSRQPLVSVVLPVYNCETYLYQSITSILEQSYHNFELIIINDQSEDKSKNIIKSFKDKRIKYIENKKNLGIAKSLNIGIKQAKGMYIARHDGDDWSKRTLFKKQVDFLEKNQEYGLLGTWAEIWAENTKTDRFHKHPLNSLALKTALLFDNPFVHSSVMIRKKILDVVGLYDESLSCAQDYELWSRIARVSQIANLPEILQIYREISTGVSQTKKDEVAKNVIKQNIVNIDYFYRAQNHKQAIRTFANFLHNNCKTVKSPLDFNTYKKIINTSISNIISQNPGIQFEQKEIQNIVKQNFKQAKYYYFRHKYYYLARCYEIVIRDSFLSKMFN
ncbi:glycosyltransferase family 2 protein [Candidatus Beckwithbacteria bacterium]|nr:glycosyltransferase family 2 protein [Candidatus Beckwithbacteria bacterium]